jgi:hypothetical protein
MKKNATIPVSKRSSNRPPEEANSSGRNNAHDRKAYGPGARSTPVDTHLDPVIRPIAAQDELTRARHILKDLYVSHPPAQQVERQIEQLIRLPRRIRMPGLFLCGDSGMGKTHLLRRVERRHPERDDPTTKRHLRPVLYVQVPAAPNVRTLRRTLIDEANIPYLDHPTKPLPQSILRRGLAAAGTELIVLDEIHNLEHVDGKQRIVLRDWVRCLSNETQRPIVLAGTEEFESAILADRQMASRYPIVRLARWSAGPDLAAFLQGYERACPLRLASHLSDPLLMQALLEETEGITDSIVRSLQAAALVGIREGTERIVAEYFSWWRDPPLLDYYEAGEAEQDSVALARAWLKDERRAAPMPAVAPARRFRNRATLATEGKRCNLPL